MEQASWERRRLGESAAGEKDWFYKLASASLGLHRCKNAFSGLLLVPKPIYLLETNGEGRGGRNFR